MLWNFINLLINLILNLLFLLHDGLQTGLSFRPDIELVILWPTHVYAFFNHFAYFIDNLDISFQFLVNLYYNLVFQIFTLKIFDELN